MAINIIIEIFKDFVNRDYDSKAAMLDRIVQLLLLLHHRSIHQTPRPNRPIKLNPLEATFLLATRVTEFKTGSRYIVTNSMLQNVCVCFVVIIIRGGTHVEYDELGENVNND